MKQEMCFVTEDGATFRTADEALDHELIMAAAYFIRERFEQDGVDLARRFVDHRVALQELLVIFDVISKEAGGNVPTGKRVFRGRKPVSIEARRRMSEAALRRNGRLTAGERQSSPTAKMIAGQTCDPEYAREIMMAADM